MSQEWELEAMDWGGGLDCLVLSARDNPIVLETNVEVFVQAEASKAPPEMETDFVPFNPVHKSRKPLPSLSYPCGLNEDLIADQHAGAVLRETGDREAGRSINFLSRLKSKRTDKWRGLRYSILASGISNFSRSRLDAHQFGGDTKYQFKSRTIFCIPHTKATPQTFGCMFQARVVVVRTSSQFLAPDSVVVC